jgi:hypothetical protein
MGIDKVWSLEFGVWSLEFGVWSIYAAANIIIH